MHTDNRGRPSAPLPSVCICVHPWRLLRRLLRRWWRFGPFLCVAQRIDPPARVALAFVHSRTDPRCRFPRAPRLNHAIPERPRPALERPDGVNPAAAPALAVRRIGEVDQKNAVVLSVQRLALAQAQAVADLADVAPADVLDAAAEVRGETADLLFAD